MAGNRMKRSRFPKVQRIVTKVKHGIDSTVAAMRRTLNLRQLRNSQVVLLKRRILVPWLLSAVVMFGISALWHGLALTDLSELKISLNTYFLLIGFAYLIVGLGLVLVVRLCIVREWITLKWGFPWKGMAIGSVAGLVVYLIILVSGLSFASHGLQHVAVDIVWQVIEQAVGGLMVSLGIIYDLHRSFMEAEQAH
jgi:uncharacterized membrane protein